jgi:hypothetical protein
MRQLLARLFLAAALVAAQHGVYAHALSHLDEAIHGHDGDVQSDHGSEVCVAFASASGGAAGSGDASLPVDAPVHGLTTPPLADPLLPSPALTRFASRAPPLLLLSLT